MMSRRPQASIADWTSLSGSPSSVRSPAYTVVSPAISPAVCSATSASRSLISTLAPCSLSNSAVARPMPRAEPVTIATLSSRTPMYISLRSQRKRGARTLVRAPLSPRSGDGRRLRRRRWLAPAAAYHHGHGPGRPREHSGGDRADQSPRGAAVVGRRRLQRGGVGLGGKLPGAGRWLRDGQRQLGGRQWLDAMHDPPPCPVGDAVHREPRGPVGADAPQRGHHEQTKRGL